nr:restriction endonuclease subunit M [Listeria monocytogenes]
ALGNEMVTLNADIKKAETDFLGLLDELAVTPDTKEIIEATKAVFR